VISKLNFGQLETIEFMDFSFYVLKVIKRHRNTIERNSKIKQNYIIIINP